MNRYFVIFKSGRGWWKNYLLKGFSHCFLIEQIEEGEYIQFDPSLDYFDIQPIFLSEKELLNSFNNSDYSILEIYMDKATIEINTSFFGILGLRLFNCVNLVKYILGIKAFFVFTPYQLYRHLKEVHNGLIRR